jgi:hypothetical protein
MYKKMRIGLAVGILMASLTGCGVAADTTEKLLEANERAHDVAESQICKGFAFGIAPVRYRDDPQLFSAWAVICKARVDRLAEANAPPIE